MPITWPKSTETTRIQGTHPERHCFGKKLFPDDPSIVCLDSANLCELHYMMGDTAKAMEMVMAI